MNIRLSSESPRGCGMRKPGGLYLVSGQGFANCGKLPIALTVCPTCHAGIHPARGFTWVGKALVEAQVCRIHMCRGCAPFDGSVETMGLIWVGEKFYHTPNEFAKEAAKMGISRRIAAVPLNFKVGETWILLAHQNTVEKKEWVNDDPDPKKAVKIVKIKNPHIFMAFKPERIEYVVKDDDDPEKLEAMEKRGISLVKVVPEQVPDIFTPIAVEASDEKAAI